jgi:type IV pilus assembly protein PilV
MKTNFKTTHSGSALLEALIAILIFSFGVLGLVGLQAAMIAGAADAKYRTEAGFFVNRLLGEMAAADRSSVGALAKFATGGDSYAAWYADIQNARVSAGLLGLPGAAANPPTVAITAGPVNNSTLPTSYNVTVSVFWKSPKQAASEAPHRHIVSASISAD